MGQLLAFLYKYRAFLLFIFLELICIWLIVQNNDYQRSTFINSSSKFVGGVNNVTRGIGDYFRLRRVNEELAAENAYLRELLLSNTGILPDSIESEIILPSDSTDSLEYVLMPAKIVKNEFRLTNNFFMINKGEKDGIKPGMGVMNSEGTVGTIRTVSTNFSEGISILNTRNSVSAIHKGTNRLGTVQWDGRNPKVAQLLYITPDVSLNEGDSIITSSFNAVYPKDLLIGTVKDFKVDDNNTYLEVDISLSVDFAKISHVYVIENRKKPEMDSLIVTSNPDLN